MLTLLSLAAAAPGHTQDKYWAMKGNKVLNTQTGHMCIQRTGEWPIKMDYSSNLARGVIDAGGHSVFTFTEGEMYNTANSWNVEATINNAKLAGGLTAFQIYPGKCKQYCVVKEWGYAFDPKINNGLTLIKVNAASVTGGKDYYPGTPILFEGFDQDSVEATNYYSTNANYYSTAMCVAREAAGGHSIIHAELTSGASTSYTVLKDMYVDAAGNTSGSLSTFATISPRLSTTLGGRIMASQDGTSVAFQDDTYNLVIYDRVNLTYLQFALGSTIYGLEQATVNGQRRWYMCVDNAIKYVEETAGATVQTVHTFPSGTIFRSDLALGKRVTGYGDKLYYAVNDELYYFNPVFAFPSSPTLVANSAGAVFKSSYGYYSFGNLVSGEDNSTADAYDDLEDYTFNTSGTINSLNSPYADFNGTFPNVLTGTWKPRKNVIIAKGTDLKMQYLNIEMNNKAKVIVEPAEENVAWAAYLTLDNTKIYAHRTGCGNENNIWEGIEVCGRGSAWPQVYLTSNPRLGRHATLEMANATLRDANWAVKNTGPNDYNTFTMGGGIIIARNSFFTNNRRSAGYAPFKYVNPANPFDYYAYRSTFTNCKFEVNTAIPNGFVGFVTAGDVDGIIFSGCSFEDKIPAGSPNSYGLMGDFGFIVKDNNGVRSRFANLHNAIDIRSTSGKFVNVDVRNTDFYNNDWGMYLNSVNFMVAANNRFDIPDNTKNPDYVGAIGLAVESSMGFTVRDNSFAGLNIYGNVKPNTGVLVTNSGATDNTIHSNTYQDLQLGNLSNFVNRDPSGFGLHYLCNNYIHNSYDEANTGFDPLYHGIASVQGSYQKPSGNTYANSTINIFNRSSQVAPITYFYGPSTPEYPHNVLDIANVNRTSTPFVLNCQFAAIDAPFYAEPRIYGNGAKTSDDAERLPMEAIGTAANLQERMALLQAWTSPYSDVAQADILVSIGQYDEAVELMSSIVDRHNLDGTDAELFGQYAIDLLQLRISLQMDGKQFRDLNEEQVAMLESIAEAGTMWVKNRAKNWLSLYDGRAYQLDILYPEMDDTEFIGGVQKGILAGKADPTKVYPNPVHDVLTIEYAHTSDKAVTIQIMDITGKVWLGNSLPEKGVHTMDVRGLANGMYLYKILENGKAVTQGKIVKN